MTADNSPGRRPDSVDVAISTLVMHLAEPQATVTSGRQRMRETNNQELLETCEVLSLQNGIIHGSETTDWYLQGAMFTFVFHDELAKKRGKTVPVVTSTTLVAVTDEINISAREQEETQRRLTPDEYRTFLTQKHKKLHGEFEPGQVDAYFYIFKQTPNIAGQQKLAFMNAATYVNKLIIRQK